MEHLIKNEEMKHIEKRPLEQNIRRISEKSRFLGTDKEFYYDDGGIALAKRDRITRLFIDEDNIRRKITSSYDGVLGARRGSIREWYLL
jgi:hypothetical protein